MVHSDKLMQPKFALIKLISGISAGTLAAIALLLPQTTLAQESDRAEDLVQPPVQYQTDTFDSTSGDQQPLSVFDIIHRANFGTTRSMQEFRLEKQQNINDAAADFRNRQLEMMQNQQQVEPAESVTPESN